MQDIDIGFYMNNSITTLNLYYFYYDSMKLNDDSDDETQNIASNPQS